MVDRALLFEKLMATFIDELGEHVRAINDDLLTLEKDSSTEAQTSALVRLFRAAHSIKGASRAVQQQPLEQICHEFEDVLTAIRDKRIETSADTFSILLSVADAMEAAGMQLRERTTLDTETLNSLMDDMRRVAAGTYAPPQPSAKTDETVAAIVGGNSGDAAHANPAAAARQDVPMVSQAISSQAESVSIKARGFVPERKSMSGKVRVGEEKLDSLLAQAGELLVARQRVEGRPADLDAMTDLVASWKTEWQGVERTLRLLVQHVEGDPLLRRSSRLAERVTSVIERNGQNLRQLEKQLDQFKRDLVDDARQLGHASRSLQDDVHRIRMFPFAEACAGLERAVRDLSRSSGKQIELIIEGGDIEMDRAVLESLSDPLLHLVRNAVDHGIESPEERQAANKTPTGTVTVSASLRGSQVNIVVADDGAGLNLTRIRRKVRELQLLEPADDDELLDCIFLPAFSTAPIVTDISGRGVGMDVVKSQVEALHGSVSVTSQIGQGARFMLSVPLTLTTLPALFVRAGKQILAIPSSNVETLIRFGHDQLRSTQGRDVLPFGDTPIPVDSLAHVMGIKGAEPPPRDRMLGVITQTGSDKFGFLVDEVLHEAEVVIKKLGPRIHRLRFVSGGVLLRSGGIALLVNAPEIIKAARGNTRSREIVQTAAIKQKSKSTRRRLMVVDDSMTTRTLLKSILQAAGHEIVAAVDGRDAWEQLQREDVELVVTDIDMPNMNGFELTEEIRRSKKLGELPIVLVTARDSDEDKARGVEAGADAYLVKSAFDQTNILETIDQLL